MERQALRRQLGEQLKRFAKERKGNWHYLVVSSGVGTTTFLRTLIEEGLPEEITGVWVPVSSENLYPYTLLRQLLHSLLDSQRPNTLSPSQFLLQFLKQHFSKDWEDLLPLASLLGLREEGEEVTIPLLPPRERHGYITTLVLRLLRRFFRTYPTFLAVDRFDLGDRDSREILKAFLSSVSEESLPCWCLLTLEERPPFERPYWTLSPMTSQELSEVVCELLGAEPREDFLEWLHQKTQGHPLFARQILLYLRERELLEEAEGCVWARELPFLPNVASTLSARLDTLSSKSRQVLQFAAVQGGKGRLSILNRVLGDNLTESLRELTERELLVVDEEGSYQLFHPLLREIVYASLLQQKRVRMHEEIARALEEDEGSLEEITYHYLQTGAREKKITYLRKLAERRTGQYLFTEAAYLYHRLLEELEEDTPLWYEIKKDVVQVLVYQREFDLAIGHVAELLETGAREDLPWLYVLLAKMHAEKEDYLAAVQYARQSLAVCDGETFVIARAKAILGAGLFRMGAVEEAEEILVQLLPQLGEWPIVKAYALFQLGEIYLFQNASERAISCFLQSCELYEREKRLVPYHEGLNKLGLLYLKTEEWTLAKKAFRKVIEFYKIVRRQDLLGEVYYHLALTLWRSGKRRSAESLFWRALGLLEEQDSEKIYWQGMCHYQLGLLLEKDRHKEGRKHLLEALQLFQRAGHYSMVRKCQKVLESWREN